MNEHIKELYEQAHDEKQKTIIDPHTFETIYLDETYRILNPKKFAELIIEKCGEIADSSVYHGCPSAYIDEYFGV